MAAPKLILASGSPRRRQLLSLTGLSYEISPAEVDETPIPGENPQVYTLRLAKAKAHCLQPVVGPGSLILAADTTVADQDSLLGKPGSPDKAREMLRQLRGRTHQVYTALAVFDPHTNRMETDLCISQVPMREYTDEEMSAYIAGGDPLDKAGAYAIQNGSFRPVTAFAGCFASVMGLPLCHVARTLLLFNVVPRDDLPRVCQSTLEYQCPIYKAVQRGENIG